MTGIPGIIYSSGGNWNPGANITLQASGSGQEWSFDIYRNGYSSCYWHVWDSARGSLFSVYPDDGHCVSNGAMYANSDRHLKKNISSIPTSSLERLFSVSSKLLKKFTWKDPERESYGFIAQELEPYIPEAITSDEKGIKSVSYDIAYAKILASIIHEIEKIKKSCNIA